MLLVNDYIKHLRKLIDNERNSQKNLMVDEIKFFKSLNL